MSVGSFFAAFVQRLRRALDRVRVRRLLRLGLPTVQEALEQNALPAPPASLRMPAYRPADEGPDYQAPAPSLRWLAGQSPPPLLLASTRALPPPRRELAVLRLDAFRLPAPLPFDRTPPVEAPLALARPELFGVEEEGTRIERTVPPPLADPTLSRAPASVDTARLRPPDALHHVEPRAFGLAEDGTPATEVEPLQPRPVMKLARARASFLFRFTEPQSVERILSPTFVSPNEGLEERIEPFFNRPEAGAQVPVEASIDESVGHALDEVREQFLLRRGIGRVEVDESELGRLEAIDGLARGSIKVFSGITFEDLQPEPVEPLKMRLANPPVDMAPSIEASTDAWAMLARALADFSSDPTKPPPVPDLPGRFKR